MRNSHKRITSLLVTVGVAMACGQNSPSPEQACEPTDATLSSDVAIENLAGDFTITFVATGADTADHTYTTGLSLHATDADHQQVMMPGDRPMPDVTTPYYGTLESNLRDMGAVDVGNVQSLDVSQPGALVLYSGQDAGTPQITIRFGSEANRYGSMRFDGGYFVLRVRELTEGSIRGSWASGVTGNDVEGYFCATKSLEN